ncbi:MAG: hypothetical protein WC319_01125 [Candidatus Paceibacterota bacterium]|jgi:hypothetical protein
MKKQHLIIFVCIMAISLMAGIYQYIQVFQTELVGAFDTDKKANGHSWSEMPCTVGLCVTVDNKVGIGTEPTVLSEKLEIVGNIKATKIMTDETVSTDPSNTVVTKGYLDLSPSQMTKVFTGTNPVCPIGEEALMKASGGIWYIGTATQVVSSWDQVSCGVMMTPDGTRSLVGGVHTSKQCVDAGGEVVNEGTVEMCRFSNPSMYEASITCESIALGGGNWHRYLNYTTTGNWGGTYNSCATSNSRSDGCVTTGHSWSNTAPGSPSESSANCYWGECACFVTCRSGPFIGYANVMQVGCC